MSEEVPFWQENAAPVSTDDGGWAIDPVADSWDDVNDDSTAPLPRIIRSQPNWLQQLWYAWQRRGDSRPYWALIGLAIAAIVLYRWGGGLNWPQISAWGFLLFLLPAAWRHSGIQLLGPMFPYDLVRTARRGRHLWFRCTYAILLLVMLYMVYTTWFVDQGLDPAAVFAGQALPLSEVPRFAESFFFAFLLVQMLAVLVLTPVYSAGAIAEEKERGTLEFILATDLASREIVIGKLASRVASMTLLIVTGLPVLSLTLFLGGIDPNLLLASFAMTLMTTLGIGCLSIYISVRVSRTLDAVAWTYLWSLAYLLVLPGIPLFNWGNPLHVYYELKSAWRWNSAGVVLLQLFNQYVFFYGMLSIVMLLLAIRRLRSLPMDPGRVVAISRSAFEFPPRKRRPRIGDRPMLWKELHSNVQIGSERFGRYLSFGSMVVACVLAAAFACIIALRVEGDLIQGQGLDIQSLGEESNLFLGVIGTILAMGMLVLVALASAAGIGRERNQQTLDSLLSTPLEADHIVYAKWVGAILSVRTLRWCLAAMWLIGIVTGGLHTVAVVLLFVGWLAQAGFVAALGLWFSNYCGSTLRATVFTLSALLVLALAPLLLQEIISVYGDHFAGAGVGDMAGRIVGIGLSPPAALWTLTFPSDLPTTAQRLSAINLLAAVLGISFYGLAGWRLLKVVQRQFRKAIGNCDEEMKQPKVVANSE
jgi:ABC-type transport system involved in multi-copper enzyme maturation permease subunit